ncbi:MAG: peptidase, partial [Polaromonas sp.]|nr:peptidase [Polaromonas sp.]
VAAQLTAPQSIVQSLIKISAYSSYRNTVERRLFAQEQQHSGALGIAGFVADGLHPYASSVDFVTAMKTAAVPHPYDTHPPLLERMRNVGHSVQESGYGAIVTATPQATWADEITTAADIEQRLWSDYEQRFAAAHEQSLAYRYEPATDEERAVVLRYFPPVTFDLGKGRRIDITYQGIHATADGGAPTSWDEVKGMTFNNSSFGNTLTITHFDKGMLGARTSKIKLRGLGKQEANFKAAVGDYWQRHQIMRAQQKARAEEAAAA